MSCSNDPKYLLMINNSLMGIREKVDHIDQKVLDLEMITLDPDAGRPRKSTWKSGTTMMEGKSNKNILQDFFCRKVGNYLYIY